jgi:hypothetical protein
VKNYSRYIKSDFSDEEPLISPEELMAKAREEESILGERGEFVVVKTGAAGLFNNNIDTTQTFVLAVKDPDFSMRTALKDFAEFNRTEFKDWNLKTRLTSAGDYQILTVQEIPSINESMSYFRKVVITRSLFESLGQRSYRNFLITGENLTTVIEEEKIDEYIDFFRDNYINQGGQPQPENKPDQTDQPEEPVVKPEPEDTLTETEEYTGPYSKDTEKPHLFVFIVATDGIDKASFIEKLEQFHEVSETTSELTIDEESLDPTRELIIISGFKDSESATRYFRMVVQNRDIYAPLGNTEYRNFLITTDNFAVFLKEKNISDYIDFYKQIYLQQ